MIALVCTCAKAGTLQVHEFEEEVLGEPLKEGITKVRVEEGNEDIDGILSKVK